MQGDFLLFFTGAGGGSPPAPPTPTDYEVIASDYTPDEFTEITITAQLRDEDGDPLAEPGRTVTWTDTGVGGSFATPTSITDNFGIATVVYTVGAGSVTHTVTATDEDLIEGTSDNIEVQGAPGEFVNFDPANFPEANFPKVNFL